MTSTKQWKLVVHLDKSQRKLVVDLDGPRDQTLTREDSGLDVGIDMAGVDTELLGHCKSERRGRHKSYRFDNSFFLRHVYSSLPDILINDRLISYITENRDDPSRLQGGKLVGPVIPHMRFSNALACIIQVTVFSIIRSSDSECTDRSAVASTLFAWPVFFVMILYRNYIEWRATQHFLIPYIKKFDAEGLEDDEALGAQQSKQCKGAGMFQVLFCCEVSALTWFLWSMLISNVAILDIRSDTIFASVAVQTLRCGGSRLEELWSQVWKQSLFGRYGVPTFGLGHVVLFSFYLSIIQFVVSFFATIQRKVFDCSYRYRYGDDGRDKHICGFKVNHEDVFISMADAADMRTIGFLSNKTVKLRLDAAISKNGLEGTHMQGVVSLSWQLLERVVFVWLMEHLVQVNVQVTFFSLHFHACERKFSPDLVQMAVSIALSFINAGISLAISNTPFHLLQLAEEHHQKTKGENTDCPDVELAILRARRILRAARACRYLLVASLVYAGMKFIGVFVCRDSVWNITGCVRFQE